MPDGPISGDAFGVRMGPTSEEQELDPFAEEAPESVDEAPEAEPEAPPTPPEGPTAPAAPEAAPPAPAEPEAQVIDVEVPPVEEQPPAAGEPPEPFEFAGQTFASRELAEDSHRNIRDLHRRSAERARAVEARNAELEGFFQQALPYLQQMAQQGGAPGSPTIAPPAEPQIDYEDPASIQRYVDSLVNQRVMAVRTELEAATQARMQAQRQQDAVNLAVNSFYDRHPDVLPGSAEETAISEVMKATRLELNIPDMERAYEITKDPRLRTVVLANPGWARDEEGMQYARWLASLPPAMQQAQQGAIDQAKNAQQARNDAARRAAHVETGGSGAPITGAPGAGPKDEVEEMVDAWKASQATSAFGI
jgi:hypothetical protein